VLPPLLPMLRTPSCLVEYPNLRMGAHGQQKFPDARTDATFSSAIFSRASGSFQSGCLTFNPSALGSAVSFYRDEVSQSRRPHPLAPSCYKFLPRSRKFLSVECSSRLNTVLLLEFQMIKKSVHRSPPRLPAVPPPPFFVSFVSEAGLLTQAIRRSV